MRDYIHYAERESYTKMRDYMHYTDYAERENNSKNYVPVPFLHIVKPFAALTIVCPPYNTLYVVFAIELIVRIWLQFDYSVSHCEENSELPDFSILFHQTVIL